MDLDKIALKAYTELKDNLNNKCGSLCPREFIPFKHKSMETRLHFCALCIKNFKFIRSKPGSQSAKCPCHKGSNPEEIFLRLDELIEELEEKVKE